MSDGRELELRDDVPGTRANCPSERPCGHVRCKAHLWMDDAADRPMQRPAGSLLKARWLESPVPTSCALDVAEEVAQRGRELQITRIAETLGVTEDWARQLVDRAIARLRARMEEP